MKLSICTSRKSTILGRSVLLLMFSLCIAHAVSAEVVELTVTGSWSDKDIKATKSGDKSYNPADPKFDGQIFGIAPAAGDITLRLLVNTNGVMFFPKGTTFTSDRTGTYSLSHDFYGYKQVTLVGDIYSFGSATWKSDGILTGLEGPNDTKAALWTDVDLTQADPARISFRMFGKAAELTTDLFMAHALLSL